MQSPYWLWKSAALRDDVKLQPHQQHAVLKARRNGGVILLGFQPGLGKTPTAYGISEDQRAHGQAHRFLAVTPSGLKQNFYDQGRQFTDARIKLINKGSDKPDPLAQYHVISYDLFRKDPVGWMKRTGSDGLIADELHKIRDDGTQNYEALMKARPLAKTFTGATGTPINNHPADIIPLLDAVTNRSHGLGSKRTFMQHHVVETKHRHGPLAFAGIGPVSTEVNLHDTARLSQVFHKYIDYQQSKDLPGKTLPEKLVHRVEVQMSPEQERQYHFSMAKLDPHTRYLVQNNLPVGTHQAQNILHQIMQSRHASNSLHLLDRHHTPLSSALHTPKAIRLLDDVEAHLKADPHHQAIISTHLIKGGVDLLSAGLTQRGIKHGLFIGKGHITEKERQQAVTDYRAGKHRVMIISGAGAEGLNLSNTTAHFSYDHHYNPAVGEQQEARGIRLDSTAKQVPVYHYFSVLPHATIDRVLGMKRPTSTDEWVYNIAEGKRRLNNQALDLMKNRRSA